MRRSGCCATGRLPSGPDFELHADNAAAVARICRALDGMPLAIELAAVWLRALTPGQLAERLDDRFALLTGGSRTALPRHRTLRAVVDWSWDLLEPAEQALARRLAVFPAGATLAMAEQVCADRPPIAAGGHGRAVAVHRWPGNREPASRRAEVLPSAHILPALSGLVDKSIIAAGQNADGDLGSRYRMLETVRAYGLERLAEAGEHDRIRDAFAAHYLNLAETTDPRLRGPGQGRWLRELAAEQDNLYAALRWAITRRDADTALRFVRALGWYWVLRGQPGEPETLARAVLELEPRERSPRMAEARMVCAMTAAGPSWEVHTVQSALAAAVADFAVLSHGESASNPVAAMAEPMLVLSERDPERALAVFDRYMTSADPWVRAAVPMMRCSFGRMLGRIDLAESDCQDSLAAFRALGDSWGAASVLIQLAELTQLRGDYPTTLAALEDAGTYGRELGAWGDLSYIDGMLAAVRLRMGDLEQARTDLEQAEHAQAERSTRLNDAGAWLALVRAELHWQEGDMATAAANCAKVLAWLDQKQSPWWDGMRAQSAGQAGHGGPAGRGPHPLPRTAHFRAGHGRDLGGTPSAGCRYRCDRRLRPPGVRGSASRAPRWRPPCSARPTPSGVPSTRAAWTLPKRARPPGACSARPSSVPPMNAAEPSAATKRSPRPPVRSAD